MNTKTIDGLTYMQDCDASCCKGVKQHLPCRIGNCSCVRSNHNRSGMSQSSTCLSNILPNVPSCSKHQNLALPLFWLVAPNNSIEKLGGTEIQQQFNLVNVLSKQFTFPQRIVHQETDLIIQFPQSIDPNCKCIINNNNNPNNYSFHCTSISEPIHLFPSIDLSIYTQRGVVAIFSQKDNAPTPQLSGTSSLKI